MRDAATSAHRCTPGIALCIWLLLAGAAPAAAQDLLLTQEPIRVDVRRTLDSLLAREDTDGDHRITVNDPRVPGTGRGSKRFWVVDLSGRRFGLSGVTRLATLLQELTLAREAGLDTARLLPARILEPPADRISRMIRELFWDGLTRTTDEQGLRRILQDEKTTTADGMHYLYIPPADDLAASYYQAIAARHPAWKIAVRTLPDSVTGQYVRRLDGRHGLLTLALARGKDGAVRPVPFVVPGGRFNEMYGWDSYFIGLGLLRDGRVGLARDLADNQVYEILSYGAVLNANRTYYLTRSQPPFLTSLLLEVYARLPKSPENRRWLRRGLEAAIREYTAVWMGPARLTATGLSRYYDTGYGAPPEAGAFMEVFTAFARRAGMDPAAFERGYRAGTIASPELDAYFLHDRAMRESGHDTSYRLIGRCADLVTVDLNSLLYKIETDLARAIAQEFGGRLQLSNGHVETARAWAARAARRKHLITSYLWDAPRGMFFDYDVARGERTGYVSATTFYPLWAGVATPGQAAALVRSALPQLEMPGGIAASTEASRGPISADRPQRQWDYPYGWSPHQILAWEGLRRYGFHADARRLAYRWLYTITINAAQYNGTVPEKFDVVGRTHEVFAEYGNVGTEFAYITREGFGWTNTSFQLGVDLIGAALRTRLNDLIPPEWIAASAFR